MWKASSTTSTILAVIIASLARSCRGVNYDTPDLRMLPHDARHLMFPEDIIFSRESGCNKDYVDYLWDYNCFLSIPSIQRRFYCCCTVDTQHDVMERCSSSFFKRECSDILNYIIVQLIVAKTFLSLSWSD